MMLPALALAAWLSYGGRGIPAGPHSVAIWSLRPHLESTGFAAPPQTDTLLNGADSQVDAAQVDLTRRTLPRIQPGTVIAAGPPDGWSHLILMARPRVARGDVNQVSPEVLRFGSMFKVAIVANMRANANSVGTTFTLDKVAVGLAMDLGGQEVIVSSATQKSQGANLDYIGRQVLAGTEQCLDEVIQVARSPQMLVFDAWSVVLREREHRRMAVRHSVLVDANSGELSTVVWLLQPGRSGELSLVDPEMHLLPRNLQEDRLLNVRADNLIVGLLTGKRDGFALVGIPPGRPIKVPDELQPLLSSRFTTPADVTALEAALRNRVIKNN